MRAGTTKVDIWSDKMLQSQDLNKQIIILPQYGIQPRSTARPGNSFVICYITFPRKILKIPLSCQPSTSVHCPALDSEVNEKELVLSSNVIFCIQKYR
jgi:hypothetical protein